MLIVLKAYIIITWKAEFRNLVFILIHMGSFDFEARPWPSHDQFSPSSSNFGWASIRRPWAPLLKWASSLKRPSMSFLTNITVLFKMRAPTGIIVTVIWTLWNGHTIKKTLGTIERLGTQGSQRSKGRGLGVHGIVTGWSRSQKKTLSVLYLYIIL